MLPGELGITDLHKFAKNFHMTVKNDFRGALLKNLTPYLTTAAKKKLMRHYWTWLNGYDKPKA